MKTESKKTLVSIGMPVYNGESFIDQALESLLSQDFDNFELIISDNASTDHTQQICLNYAQRDDRIRYYRNEYNKGAVWNFNKVFELSFGKYFMWAAHDDCFEPSYLNSCLNVLSSSETIILAGTACQSVDSETDKPIFIDHGFSTIGLSPKERFIRYKTTIHSSKHIGAIFYGLWRRSLVTGVKPLKKVVGCDHIFLAELCFKGEFITIPEKLMVKRWGGASLSHHKNASAMGINNPVLTKCPYFIREILLQTVVCKTDKLTAREKFHLCLWSFNHYIRTCAARSTRRKFQGLLNRVRNIPRQILSNVKK